MKQFFFFVMLASGLGFVVNNYVSELPQMAPTQTANAAVPVTLPDHVMRGEETFNQFCQHCHDFQRGGRPDDVMDLNYYRGDLAEFEALLSADKGDMPTFEGMFEDAQLKELRLSYILV